MQHPSQHPSGYRSNQPPSEDSGAEARFQADLARLQKAKGWRSFMFSKTDPAARKRFFMTLVIMCGMGLGGLRACAQSQRSENHRMMLRDLQSQQNPWSRSSR